MYSDTFFVIKKDGTRTGPFKGVYGEGRMATQNAEPDIEDGDKIARMVGKREEIYDVIDCSYSPGHPGAMEPFFNPRLRKSTAPAPTPQSVTYNTNVHGGNAQVGQQNTMEVTNRVEQNLTQIIEKSAATPDQKTEAKSALTKFLTNEGFKAVLESLTSSATEGIAKGLKG